MISIPAPACPFTRLAGDSDDSVGLNFGTAGLDLPEGLHALFEDHAGHFGRYAVSMAAGCSGALPLVLDLRLHSLAGLLERWFVGWKDRQRRFELLDALDMQGFIVGSGR